MASFRVVSATLKSKKFDSTLITSGRAPFTLGSKAALAASIDAAGTTLLWESFQNGNTSDVSIAVSGFYEAAVKAYNARITAKMENVYKHFSKVVGKQGGYRKREVRSIVDDMQRDQSLKIEVLDQSKALGVDASSMDAVLSLVTDKLTEAMFDRETGWSKDPVKEAVEPSTGRVRRGWLGRLFKGSGNQKYITDDRFVLKKRQDIKISTFTLQLNQNTTIKVPFESTGNLGGIYNALQEDESNKGVLGKYFRVVRLDDPAYEIRTIQFLIDGDYIEAFADRINAVSFQFKRLYPDGQPAITKSDVFNYQDVSNGNVIKDIRYPRAGSSQENWLADYGQYRIVWNMRDLQESIEYPGPNEWADVTGTAITLTPPFARQDVKVYADAQLMRDAGTQRGMVRFATVLAGETKWVASAEITPNAVDPLQTIAIYHDRDAPIISQITWYVGSEVVIKPRVVLDGDYIYALPPLDEERQ